MNETDKFLDDLKTDTAPLDTPLEPEKAPEAADEGGETDIGELKPRNRRERRLQAALTAERESSIFLAGKLEARTEAERALTEESDYLKGVERIYGTATPEAQLATDLLKKAIAGARDEAEERAWNRMQAEREREAEAQREADRELDGIIDDLEDTYNVELTEPQERAYFRLLQEMSPKQDGVVTEYADPHAVWGVFQERIKNRGTGNRARDLASRSMVSSGSSESTLKADASERFLKDNGII